MHRGGKSSKYYGVTWNKNARKWEARVKPTYLGLFTDEKEASKAVEKHLKKLEEQTHGI